MGTPSATCLALLALCSGPAAAQCPSASGPDLIVGDVAGVANQTASGGFDALMMGVSFCNLGTQSAGWVAVTTDHPVLVQALYRLSAPNGVTRCEQIGMSWAHHQSSALAQGLCCTCPGGGSIAELQAGCSTTSSASAVGAQSTLGPRHEVDPLSGAFAWPASSPPVGGALDRRLRFAVADTPASSASVRYFGELQVVAPGDAAAFNRGNNVSHRELACSGGANPAFSLMGTTVRGQPALAAWAAADPLVVLSPLALDGALLLGQRATDVGDGWWHYEYALHNQDARAGAGSFEVAIPPGVALRGVGFHGVAHHSGDGPGGVDPDAADWSWSFSGGALRWATQPFASNPQANALRWGTTFNFRFEASAPPGSGVMAVGRFEPGLPDAATVTGTVPGQPAASSAFCLGDGAGTACPCGNSTPNSAGEGCAHSFGHGGRLAAGGVASLSADTLVLQATGLPNSSVLFFQGTSQVAGGAGSVFGDGLRCAGGTVVRLALRTAVGGAASYPAAGDAPIAVRGGVLAPGPRTYQAWFRNAAAFCSSATFNLTGGIEALWLP